MIKNRADSSNRACESCVLALFCLHSLPESMQHEIDRLVKQQIQLAKSESFTPKAGPNLYALKDGVVKVHAYTADGKERITNFFLSGEVLGFDSMHAERFQYQVTALQPSILCEIPLEKMLSVISSQPHLQHRLLKVISQQMSRNPYVTFLSAEARIVGFLLALSKRLGRDNYHLPFNREDIGNYLGLAAETVTRILTRLQDQKLIEIHSKEVKLMDVAGLEHIVSLAQ